MKKILKLQIAFVFLLTAMPLVVSAQTTFFSDNFTNGSTINSATPVSPTTNSTSYETLSSLAEYPPSSITANDLRFGLTNTGGGNLSEIQALFATNAVALTVPGDYIQLTVVYTNFWGIYSGGAASGVSFGLYNSGQVLPWAGGLNGNEGDGGVTTTIGGAQNWVGYMEQVATSSNPNYRLFTRPAQAETTDNNQDLTSNGSSTKSFTGGATLATGTAYVLPSTNQVYTDVFTIKLNGANSVAITNQLYTNSAVVDSSRLGTTLGGIATNANFLTGGFDAFAMGFYKKTDSSDSNVLDIASITVSGSVTIISGPPTITSQPVPVTVATNGACAFSVSANGFSVTYQWERNGTNLIDGGNISGSKSSLLVVAPAGTNDVLSSANGYSVKVSGAGGFSTNSVTNSLTLVAATNLTWTDNNANNTWDLNNTVNWQDASLNQLKFNYGDPVTFDDTGAGGSVVLSGQYLSAASVTVNSSYNYDFSGGGSFAGPGNLIYEGTAELTIGNANTYSGGTIISNASAHLLLQNYNGLGTGPVTLGLAGGLMEIVPGGSAALGINGNVIVADDFTIQYDANGSFAGVFLGNLSGTVGKTLTLVPTAVNTTTNDRIRVYGNSTTNNANLFLNSPLLTFAPYNSGGNQTYNGVISGTGSIMEKGSLTYLNGPNTYSGGTFPVSGVIALGIDSVGFPAVTSGPIGTGPLFLTIDSTTTTTGSGMIFASGGPVTIGNPIQYPTGTNNLTLIIGGTNNLTLSGAFTLNGNDNLTTNTFTARTVQVTNTGLTTISGVISDLTNGVSAAYGFTKTGSGVLALNNTETYTGPTTNSGGTLQVNGSLNAASAVTVSSGATLAGSGTINGTVTVNAGGALAPGAASIGTLNINNNLTLSGNINVRVNRSGFVSDEANVSGALTNAGTGTVTVTNLGSALQTGDTFTLFNKPLTNGAALTITGAGMSWQNNLAVNGTIQVLGSLVLVPTNSARITGFSMASGNAVINATNGQSGGTYYLLASTNVSKPLSQWAAVATNIVNTNGASGAFTFTGTNVVTSGGQQFYILSNTNN